MDQISSFLVALIPVLAWGTWLTPSQNVRFKNQQIKTFYVAVANLALAFVVTIAVNGFVQLTPTTFWPPFIGGLIWALSAFCAFTGTNKIGMVRAFGIWAPLNILVSIFWGRLLFDEFLNTGALNLVLTILAVAVMIIGILMIIFARGAGERSRNQQTFLIGLLSALGAGVLWGTYFIPIKLAGVSMWVGGFPLAVGIFVGSTLLALLGWQSPKLEQRKDYFRVCLTGLLWGIGNYGMLLLVERLGAGKGFTIAQLSVVVAALVGIYWLKDPPPRTRAATLTLLGCVLATFSGIILGNLK